LRDALQASRPYDQVARELLTATGANKPGTENYNGAVNFLLSGVSQRAEEATDRTARVMLGKQLFCTKCHEHPANDWHQHDFWALNAFFRQMRVQRDAESGAMVLADGDFFGESGTAKDAEIFYRPPRGGLKIAYPEFDGHALSHSGLVDEVHRRRQLAKLLVASDSFRQAAVNRIWAHLIGYGFTQPVDDMGPHNPASHPAVLERLSQEFAAHDFNLQGLMRWIVLSEAFQRSSRSTPESWMDAPELGGKPLFARHYAAEDAPVDVYRALIVAADSRSRRRGAPTIILARRSWSGSRDNALQIIDSSTDDHLGGTGWLDHLAESDLRMEQKIQHVFLSVLARRPTSRELTAAKLVLADRLNDSIGLREIWRTLLASKRPVATDQ
jgi:hypothetical protein